MDIGASLQSGFVLAAIVAAVLVARHLGGGDEIARRFYQIIVAAAIAFAVVGGTTAFIRPPEYEESSFSDDFEDEDEEQLEFFEEAAGRAAVRAMVHYAAGIIAVGVSLALLRRMPTIGLGVLLSGVLLVLFGGAVGGGSDSADPLSAYFAAFGGLLAAFGRPSQVVDIAHFAVLAVGALALLAVGVLQWEQPEPASVPETAPPAV